MIDEIVAGRQIARRVVKALKLHPYEVQALCNELVDNRDSFRYCVSGSENFWAHDHDR